LKQWICDECRNISNKWIGGRLRVNSKPEEFSCVKDCRWKHLYFETRKKAVEKMLPVVDGSGYIWRKHYDKTQPRHICTTCKLHDFQQELQSTQQSNRLLAVVDSRIGTLWART